MAKRNSRRATGRYFWPPGRVLKVRIPYYQATLGPLRAHPSAGAGCSVTVDLLLLRKIVVFFSLAVFFKALYRHATQGALGGGVGRRILCDAVILSLLFIFLYLFSFFVGKKCVARAAIASRHLERFLGAPKASLGGPALRRFRCLRQGASSVGIRRFFCHFFLKNVQFFLSFSFF